MSIPEESIHWLKDYKFENLTHPTTNKQNKFILANKLVRQFWEVCLKRIQELWLGYEFAREKKYKTVMALCSRAALETMALPMREIIFLEKCLREKKINDFFKFHEILYLGYRESNGEPEKKAKHILNVISDIDKYFEKELKIPNFSFRAKYDELSNFCHPNWHGVAFSNAENLNEPQIKTKESVISLFELMLPIIKKMDETFQNPNNFKELNPL